MADNNEKIYVEVDYDNIILIDGNKIVENNGTIHEREVKQENLVIYANLEALIIPRTRSNISFSNETEDNLVTIATNNFSNINFMNPNSGYFTSEWTDDITGNYSLKKKGKNQIKQNTVENSDFKIKQSIENKGNSETLGIETIVVTNNMSQTPNVTIDLIDVQGRTLFEQGENSPYASFLNLPYPTFFLTLKGYYGKAIKYQLMLKSFNSELDSSNGNFRIRLSFVSYKYMILADLQVGTITALPNMYSSKYELSYTNENNSEENNKEVKSVSITRGYQKIKELYKEYKAKKLIPENFPELSVPQFILKLENFEKNILSSLGEENFFPFTDVTNLRSALNEFRDKIFSDSEDSWSSKYLNLDDYLLSKSEDKKIYRFKKEVRDKINKRQEAENEYNLLLNEFLKKWKSNATLCSDGSFFIGGVKKQSGIDIDFSYNKIKKILNLNDVDWCLTQKRRFNDNNTLNCRESIENRYGLNKDLPIYDSSFNEVDELMFSFQGKNSFFDEFIKVQKQINDTDELIELEIKNEIEKKFESIDFMGFKPTIRNVFAIIFASIEGVFRLLDEVHEKAYKERYNRVRQNAILGGDKDEIGVDGKGENNGNIEATQIYPWPEFFIKKEDEKTTKFNLCYPGDPEIISITQGNNYDIWPEVEFVEEMIRAIANKDVTFTNSDFLLNSGKTVKRLSINASEFPITSISYSSKKFIDFIYEIKERLELMSSFDRLNRVSTLSDDISNYIFEYELYSILKSLEDEDFDLISLIKNINVSSTLNFEKLLKQISNEGNGEKWQLYIRGITTTPYLKPIIDDGKDFAILNYEDYTSPDITVPNAQVIDNFLKNKSKLLDLFDVYPMNNIEWIKNNVSNGNNINSLSDFIDISGIIGLNKKNSEITNFDDSDNEISKRPLTTFKFLTSEPFNDFISSDQITNFYGERIYNNTLIPTEGLIHNTGNTYNSTTSIFNTSFFINSINTATEKLKSGDPYPFKESAFLFLNSLPLATLREEFISSDNGVETRNGYILPSLKMFSGIHRIPYPWILKYGAIWNRYKTFIETGVDFLEPVWKKTDHTGNFDPITNNPTNTYSLSIGGEDYSIIKEFNSINTTNLNFGFYPKLINDLYFIFTGTDIFSAYTSTEIQEKIDNDEISLILTDMETKLEGTDPDNTNRIILMKFWTSFIKTNNSSLFTEEEQNKIILTPSFASVTNEGTLNCFDGSGSLVNEVVGNDALFDGAARLFWASPNYGFFKAGGITIPKPNEYLKKINPSSSQQYAFFLGQEYSPIEELTSTFKQEILDEFEKEFLDFSKASFSVSGTKNTIKENFHLLLKKLLTVDSSDINNTNYLERIWTRQSDNFKDTIHTFLLDNDKFIKLGNVSNFNRRIFNSFTTKTIVDPIVPKSYVPNTLMPEVSLEDSILNNGPAWNAMLFNVGNFNEGLFSYSDLANPFTDFFIDNDIEFSEENVKLFYPLIQIYGTKKAEGQYNKTMFAEDLYSYITTNIDNFENKILNKLIIALQDKLPNVGKINQKIVSAADSDQGKLDLWQYFKVFNDRWIAGNRFPNKTLFEDVLFLDRASRDLGDLVYIDIFKLKNSIRSLSEGKGRVIDLISLILEENKFIMMPLPAFVNFYGVKSVGEEASLLENSSKNASDLFGTFLNVDYRDASPKLVCFYSDIPSQHLDLKKNKDYLFRTDAFDIGSSKPNPNRETLLNKTDWERSNKCLGFNVDFGTRDQGMFKTFSLAQDSKTNTSETFKVFETMAQGAGNRSVAQESVSLWSEYRSRSYTCMVISMGNAMIQPTMYFNLRHVPMFSGPYLIIGVEHVITSGDFITKFTGVRIPIYSLPTLNNSLSSLNVNLFKDSINKLRKKYQKSDFSLIESNNSINSKNRIYFSFTNEKMVIPEGCILNEEENNPYILFTPAPQATMDVLSVSDLIGMIKNIIPATDAGFAKKRALLFHVIYMEGESNGNINSWNMNLGGIPMKDNSNTILKYPLIKGYAKKEYLCLKDQFSIIKPYFVFDSYENAIKAISGIYLDTYSEIDTSNITSSSFDDNTLSTSIFKNWLRNWVIKEDFNLIDLKKNNNERIEELSFKTSRCVGIMRNKELFN